MGHRLTQIDVGVGGEDRSWSIRCGTRVEDKRKDLEGYDLSTRPPTGKGFGLLLCREKAAGGLFQWLINYRL